MMKLLDRLGVVLHPLFGLLLDLGHRCIRAVILLQLQILFVYDLHLVRLQFLHHGTLQNVSKIKKI